MTEPRVVLDQLNLVVRDMDAMVAFYRRLGVDIPDRDPAWDPHHRSAASPGSPGSPGLDLDLDSERFAGMWNAGWGGSARPGLVIGFRVATRAAVDEIHDELVGAGYRSQQPPYDAFWGSRYAVVEDPDGNAVGLMSPRDDAFRSEPPRP